MTSREHPTSRDGATTLAAPVGLDGELQQVEHMLDERGQLGVLSITVLERGSRRVEDGWEDYEGMLRAIAAFLAEYLRRDLRRTDLLLEPVVAGNSYLLFLSPPRAARALDLIDVTQVRHRLCRSLNLHLWSSLPHSAVQRFGVYVGAALLYHDRTVDPRRMIYRSVESAFADALVQRHEESRRHGLHLKRILQTGRLDTVFQPVVDWTRRAVLGYEALTRVRTRHFPTPDLLFKVATEQGALWKLERLSRSRALASLPPLDAEQLLFLNIEPDSIHDPELSGEDFLRSLRDVGLRPEQLVLEMTEHAAVRDFAAFREHLARHREVGFRLAMDDVGSGYAGLNAIAEVRPDFLKVDMGIVRDVHRHAIKRELIDTICRFSTRTGCVLVAEGVEQPEELRSLIDAGVRCAQGYLFARPAALPTPPDWARIEQQLAQPALSTDPP